MTKTNILILLSIVVFLCSCQSRIDLKSDENLLVLFTDSEINEIEKMVNYVDDFVIDFTKENDIEKAYHSFFVKVNDELEKNSNFISPLNELEKYSFLESLDSSIYYDFWNTDFLSKEVRYKDSIYSVDKRYISLDIQAYGRYVKYVQKTGESDEFYEGLGEVFELAGDIPINTAIWFSKNHQDFDFKIPKNRLFAAIYILRLEDSVDEKMERYLNQ